MAQVPQVEGNGRGDSEPIELVGWLRPAQAGVALAGSARPDHIAATLVDLNIRGHIVIEQTAAGEGGVDWMLTRRTGRPRVWRMARFGSGDVTVRYERALLFALPRRHAFRLSQASQSKRWRVALTSVYRQLNREAVRRGFIRPVLTGEMTGDRGAGEDGAADVVATVRAFRSYLAGLKPTGAAWDRFREYLPYAVAFGLTPEWAERFAGLGPPASVPPGSDGFASHDAGLGAAFAGAACTHIQSAVGHGGWSGPGGGHGGSGHGGGGHGGHDGGGGHHGW